MVEVIFYRLGKRPPMSGDVEYAAAAEGRVSRGRKWYRLEAAPADAYLFPDGATSESVCEWFDAQAGAHDWCAFALDGEVCSLHNIDGGMVETAIRFHNAGRPGWVVLEK